MIRIALFFLRIVIACVIGLVFATAFLGAFGRAFDAFKSPITGIFVAFLSALAWGVSVLGQRFWGGLFNMFAALFAALALGLTTPRDGFCPVNHDVAVAVRVLRRIAARRRIYFEDHPVFFRLASVPLFRLVDAIVG